LSQLQPKQVEVIIARVEEDEESGVDESELDEMWSFVSKKTNPRWLWHAIDRQTGQVLAYVFGGVMTKRFCNSRSYLNPLASNGSVLMDGVPTKDIYQHICMKWVNGILKELSANIFDSEPESSDLPVGLSAFPNLRRCTIW
jgi:hypothetical protein